MAKNKNTYEKRRKEMERTRKAQEKRERRHARKSGDVESEPPTENPAVQKPGQINDKPVARPSQNPQPQVKKVKFDWQKTL